MLRGKHLTDDSAMPAWGRPSLELTRRIRALEDWVLRITRSLAAVLRAMSLAGLLRDALDRKPPLS